jgi:hypothetical protein
MSCAALAQGKSPVKARLAGAAGLKRGFALPGSMSVLLRIVVSLAALLCAWATLDQIHDRATEIVVSCIGLVYCLLAVVSRRWQYFGPSLLALLGAAAARGRNEPYDMALRDEAGLRIGRGLIFVTQFGLAALAALCAFRLAASLGGPGWERLSAPLRDALTSPWLEEGLRRL